MQFLYDGEMYIVVRISGPEHNMLGLSFMETDSPKDFPIEIDDLEKDHKLSRINAFDVKTEVLEAVMELNNRFNTTYKIKKIKFVSSDTCSLKIYQKLVEEIIKRIISGGEFKKI